MTSVPTARLMEYEVSEVVKDIVASGCLGKSSRQSDLLEYLLNNSLAGTIPRVSQYSIAIDVLGRSDKFDPNIDSIVRVEMHRLRANLKTYNAKQLSYLVTIPASGFLVNVQQRRQKISLKWIQKKMTMTAGLALALSMFFLGYAVPKPQTNLSNVSISDQCSTIIPNLNIKRIGQESETQKYVEKVIRSTIAQQTSFNLISPTQKCDGNFAPSFNLEYALVQQDEREPSIAFSVSSEATKKIIASHHVTAESADDPINANFFYSIVEISNTLSMPDSLLAQEALREEWPNESSKENYRCLSLMYASFSGGTSEELQLVYDCLEGSLVKGVAPLDNYGALASSYLEIARHNRQQDPTHAFGQAVSILDKFGDNWIDSSELTIAKLYYEIQRPDYNAERLEVHLFDSQARYNTNPQVLLMVAWRYGFSLGKWDEAIKISSRIERLYPQKSQSVYIIEAGYALAHLEGTELIEKCAKVYAEDSVYINIIVNACARKAEDPIWYNITETNLQNFNVVNLKDKMEGFETTRNDFHFTQKIKNLLEKDMNL